MVQLLGYLEANGFSNYIASGGGRDFVRPISDDVYNIPRERVIGSSTGLAYVPGASGGTLTRQAAIDYLDDGPEKPIHIWSRTGRRPVLAAGNSNGDIEMLDFTQHDDRPHLRLLVLHDDPDASSTTSQALRGLSSSPSSAAGRSSASGTTGPRSSDDVGCRTSPRRRSEMILPCRARPQARPTGIVSRQAWRLGKEPTCRCGPRSSTQSSHGFSSSVPPVSFWGLSRAYLSAVGEVADSVTFVVGSIFFTAASLGQLLQAQTPAMTSRDPSHA